MKTPRHLPRHSVADVRLFRLIAWGAFVIVAVFTMAAIVAYIAGFHTSEYPLYLAAVPLCLALLLCWWLIDVAPVVSRRLVAMTAFAATAGIVSIGFYAAITVGFGAMVWDLVQWAALLVYTLMVSREAWRQLRRNSGHELERE